MEHEVYSVRFYGDAVNNGAHPPIIPIDKTMTFETKPEYYKNLLVSFSVGRYEYFSKVISISKKCVVHDFTVNWIYTVCLKRADKE